MMKERKFSKKIMALILSITVCLSFVPLAINDVEATSYHKMKIEWFNVGAGDSMFMALPNGKTVLIDGGLKSKGSSVVSKIKRMGYSTVNYVVSTHPDADHCGGLQQVFKSLKVRNFYYPGDTKYSTQTAKEVIRLAKRESNCSLKHPSRGTTINGGNGCTLRFVQKNKDYTSDNEDSLAMFINYGKLQVLVCGDNEDGSQLDIEKHNVDILQLPHHGSKYATTSTFIRRFDPEKIVVSTDGHRYGHPNKEVFSRCKAYDKNIKVWRTDKKGDIIVTASKSSWKFSKTGVPVSTYCTSSAPVTGGSSGYVYITKTGKKYHCKRSCRGLANATTVYKVTKSKAKSKGLTPCKVCY